MGDLSILSFQIIMSIPPVHCGSDGSLFVFYQFSHACVFRCW